jgi:transposase-like protein
LVDDKTSTIASSSAPAMARIGPAMHVTHKQVVRAPRQRCKRSSEFKRMSVARSLEPSMSVAATAMEVGISINANLLCDWRRRHRKSAEQAEPAPRPMHT